MGSRKAEVLVRSKGDRSLWGKSESVILRKRKKNLRQAVRTYLGCTDEVSTFRMYFVELFAVLWYKGIHPTRI